MRDTNLASSIRENLGSESAGQWINVMDLIRSSLPFLLQAGRPTNEQIASSDIGLAGFSGWRDMVETLPKNGGLGWSYDSYKAWKKAYSLVLKHPYLRDLSLSSSEINTIQRENKEFPATLEAFENTKEKRKDALDGRRLNAVAGLQKQLLGAKNEAAALQTNLENSRVSGDQFKSLVLQLRQELAQANEKTGALQVQVERQTSIAKQRKEKIESLEKNLEDYNSLKFTHERFGKYVKNLWNSSRWQLFIAFCKGSLPKPQEVAKIVNRKS